MEMIYTAPNGAMVHLVKSVLEDRGIECIVRGEYLALAAGGVAPIDAWVELWVVDQYRIAEARGLVENIVADAEDEDESAERWLCPDCLEWSEDPFTHCWNCGTERLQ